MSSNNGLSVQVYASAHDVKEWGNLNGFDVTFGGGRVSFELAKAYNRTHGTKYVPGKFTKTVTVEGRKDGKRVTRKVSPAAVREAARVAGLNVGERGRVSTSVAAALLGLSVPSKPVSEDQALRAKAAAAGVSVGKRGPLSATVRASLNA